MEFGQTPKQLFTKPHPRKRSPIEIAKTETKLLTMDTTDLEHSQLATELSDDVSELCVNIAETQESVQLEAASVWTNIGESLCRWKVKCEHNLHKGSVTHACWSQTDDSVYSVSSGEYMCTL